MQRTWTGILWSQFGAAIDGLHVAIGAIPESLWRSRLWPADGEEAAYSEVWNVAFHTLFWLDLYLSGAVEGFSPPHPFGLEELDPRGALPPRPYAKQELLGYLGHCRRKCRRTLEAISDETPGRICTFSWGSMPFVELQLYNMRHVQEHTGQLNLFLGQQLGWDPGWIGQALPKDDRP
jgi:hypothetical protein